MYSKIKNDLFEQYTYTVSCDVSYETIVDHFDQDNDIKKKVYNTLARNIADELIKTMTLYADKEPEQGVVRFSIRPVFMDVNKFSQLLDEYAEKVIAEKEEVEIGPEDYEDTSGGNPGTPGPNDYRWSESNSDQD